MFHVKPWADTITFAAVSDTLSSPRVMGSPMSGAMFHVKHDRRPSTRPIDGCSAKTTVGPRHSVSRPHRESQDQSRLLLVKRRSRRQRIDQAGEVLITRKLNGDAPLLRSPCHLHASVEGIGQPSRERRERGASSA